MGITRAEFDALIQSTFNMWIRVTDSVWDVNIIIAYIIGMLILLCILLLLKITNGISCFDLFLLCSVPYTLLFCAKIKIVFLWIRVSL